MKPYETTALSPHKIVRSIVMIEAAQRQQVGINRVSFVDALRWLVHANPGDELVKLVVNPRRSNRYEPRVRKRRSKKYKLMNQPRAILNSLPVSCPRCKVSRMNISSDVRIPPDTNAA
jgi:hypothetical protein